MIKFENARGTIETEVLKRSGDTITRKMTVWDNETQVNFSCVQKLSMKDGNKHHFPIEAFTVLSGTRIEAQRLNTPKRYYDNIDSQAWSSFRDQLWFPYFNEVDEKLFTEPHND